MATERLAVGKEAITLSRAAEVAGVPLWDFIALMKDGNLELHYDVGDFEADVESLAELR